MDQIHPFLLFYNNFYRVLCDIQTYISHSLYICPFSNLCRALDYIIWRLCLALQTFRLWRGHLNSFRGAAADFGKLDKQLSCHSRSGQSGRRVLSEKYVIGQHFQLQGGILSDCQWLVSLQSFRSFKGLDEKSYATSLIGDYSLIKHIPLTVWMVDFFWLGSHSARMKIQMFQGASTHSPVAQVTFYTPLVIFKFKLGIKQRLTKRLVHGCGNCLPALA